MSRRRTWRARLVAGAWVVAIETAVVAIGIVFALVVAAVVGIFG